VPETVLSVLVVDRPVVGTVVGSVVVEVEFVTGGGLDMAVECRTDTDDDAEDDPGAEVVGAAAGVPPELQPARRRPVPITASS
jgi:hypothetical protein